MRIWRLGAWNPHRWRSCPLHIPSAKIQFRRFAMPFTKAWKSEFDPVWNTPALRSLWLRCFILCRELRTAVIYVFLIVFWPHVQISAICPTAFPGGPCSCSGRLCGFRSSKQRLLPWFWSIWNRSNSPQCGSCVERVCNTRGVHVAYAAAEV